MMVMEKTRDIAVMMSFGVEPGQVRRIFLMQGLLISIIGTALGLVLGYTVAFLGAALSLYPSLGGCLLHRHSPLRPAHPHGVIVTAMSIGVSLLATLYPSTAAARVLPAEALRYE